MELKTRMDRRAVQGGLSYPLKERSLPMAEPVRIYGKAG